MSTNSDGAATSAAVVIGALAGILYLLCAAPTIYWLDSAEFCASIYLLGVSHPTGFPLLHVMGKGFTLLPIGSIAFRINLLAALSSAGTLAIVYRLLLAQQEPHGTLSRHLAPLIAVIGLGGALSFWMHAGVAEIYSLNLLWISVLLLLLSEMPAEIPARRVWTVALWCGLGLGSHVTFIAIAVGLTLLTAITRRRTLFQRIGGWLPAALGFALLGSVILLYLPLAGARAPLHHWGPTENWAGFIDQITARTIRDAFKSEIGGWNLTALLEYSRRHVDMIWTQAIGPLALALPGGLLLIRRRKLLLLVLLAAVIGFDWFFTIKINPMGMVDLQTGTPTLLALAILAGFGALFCFEALQRVLPAKRAEPIAATVTLLIGLMLCLPGALQRTGDKFLGGEYTAYDHIVAGARQMLPDPILFTVSDTVSAGWLYLQGVENRRPDATPIIRQFLGSSAYHRSLSRHHARPRLQRLLARHARAPDLLQRIVGLGLRRHPVYWEFGDGRTDRLVWTLAECGFPLCRLRQKPQRIRFDQLLQQYRRLGLLSVETSVLTRVQLGSAFRYLIAYYLGLRRVSEAVQASDLATRLNPQDSRAWLNRGVLADIMRRYDVAEEMTLKAVELDPLSIRGWLNLATYRRLLKRLDDAELALEQVRRLAPQHHRLFYELAEIARARGDLQTARQHARKSARLNPNSRRAKKLLKLLKSTKIKR